MAAMLRSNPAMMQTMEGMMANMSQEQLDSMVCGGPPMGPFRPALPPWWTTIANAMLRSVKPICNHECRRGHDITRRLVLRVPRVNFSVLVT